MLFVCYEFMHEMGMKPKNWLEFFDFLKYSKVKGLLKERAMAKARAEMGNGR